VSRGWASPLRRLKPKVDCTEISAHAGQGRSRCLTALRKADRDSACVWLGFEILFLEPELCLAEGG
jgi:hypothetical protein